MPPGGDETRAGGKTLTLLGAPHVFLILQSLSRGKKVQLDLRREGGSPAQTTLRRHLTTLEGAGAMLRCTDDVPPAAHEYEITEPGVELLAVANVLQRWLDKGPAGELVLGGDPGKAAIKGLVEGWASSIFGVLAAAPLSLTGLDAAIDTVNYPTLGRRLGALRVAGQIEGRVGVGNLTKYAVTDWVRQGTAPLFAAARWEHRNRQVGATPLVSLDLEHAFLLIAPLFEAPIALPGRSRIALRVQDDKRKRRYTASVDLKDGGIVYSFGDPEGPIDGWVSGSTTAWFSAVIDGNVGGLEFNGDRDPALAILERLHRTLYVEDELEGDAAELRAQG